MDYIVHYRANQNFASNQTAFPTRRQGEPIPTCLTLPLILSHAPDPESKRPSVGCDAPWPEWVAASKNTRKVWKESILCTWHPRHAATTVHQQNACDAVSAHVHSNRCVDLPRSAQNHANNGLSWNRPARPKKWHPMTHHKYATLCFQLNQFAFC